MIKSWKLLRTRRTRRQRNKSRRGEQECPVLPFASALWLRFGCTPRSAMTRNPLHCKGLRTWGILLDEQGAVGFRYAKAKIPRRAAAMSPRAARRSAGCPCRSRDTVGIRKHQTRRTPTPAPTPVRARPPTPLNMRPKNFETLNPFVTYVTLRHIASLIPCHCDTSPLSRQALDEGPSASAGQGIPCASASAGQ